MTRTAEGRAHNKAIELPALCAAAHSQRWASSADEVIE